MTSILPHHHIWVYPLYSQRTELLNFVTSLYSDSLRPLNYILGHAEYLEYLLSQGDTLDNLDDKDVQESLEAIRRHSHIAIENWRNVYNYMFLNYGEISLHWQAQHLHEACEMAVAERLTRVSSLTVQLNVSQDLPLIRGNEWLVTLVRCLLYSPIDNYQPKRIIIETNQHVESRLNIQVTWQEVPESLLRMSTFGLFDPGHLSIAKLILEKIFGENLEVEFSGNEIRFRFSLSIWQT